MKDGYIRAAVRQLHAYVPGEQPKRRDILKLNTNENPYPPSPRVADALRGADAESLRLYPDPVCGGLRDRIAQIHDRRPEQVFVGNGSDEVLALCARAFSERDGAIGYFDPSYSLYPVLAAIEGIQTRPVPLGPDFSWNMPDGFESDLFFLTYPNAPTGIAYDRRDIDAFCARFQGVVLIDEAYVDFARVDCADLSASMPNVLVARTLSKSFSLAGLRLGYALGPEPLVDALYKIKDSYNISALTQRLALAALDDLDWMRSHAAMIVSTRERTAAALAGMGFAVSRSDTNFLWARPPGAPAEDWFRGLREDGIFVRYFPGERTGWYLRITIGTDAQMDRFLEAVAKRL